jgi:hypothetical protein
MAWVRPLLQALEKTERRWEVNMVIWPRLFLSGRETEIARQLPGVFRVLNPFSSLTLVAGVMPVFATNPALPTLVLHMGGAAALSLRLGQSLGAPVLAYDEQPGRLPAGFDGLYCTDSGDSVSGAIPIGNLLVDSVAALHIRRSERGPGEAGLAVGLMPGSRALQLRHFLTRIGPVVEEVTRRVSGVGFLIGRSPLVDDAMLRKAVGTHSGARLEGEGDATAFMTGQGLCIPLRSRGEVLESVDCLVSTPGTNTGEAAALGIPHLVIAPFDPSLPLLTGLPGLIERSPWPGQPLKRWVLRRLTDGMTYYAQANARAGREITPELQGPLNIGRVTECLVALLLDHRRRECISQELAGVMGPPGAARRLVSALDRRVSTPGKIE